MVNANEPVFIVGTLQEAGRLEERGCACRVFDGSTSADDLALWAANHDRYAIIHLNDQAAEAVEAAFVVEGVPYHVADPEHVTGSGVALSFWAEHEHERACGRMAEARERAHSLYLERMGVHDVLDVALQLASGQADRERVPTGLQTLDRALGGGLPCGGLVVLGATSSSGKTTLALQVADNAAASGRPVLFVTIEQGRHELVAKSISRLMRLQERKHGWYSVGASDIQSAEARGGWDGGTRDAFDRACTTYAATIAPNLHVMETDDRPAVSDIRKAAEAIRNHRGTAPLVVIDYLQLLRPESDRMTDKAAVDVNVMALRHLARDLGAVVFVISSLNRASYATGVTMEAFKESGSIEFGADVLLGMQPRSLAERLEVVAEAKQRAEARAVEREFKQSANREVVVTVLKNRGGAVHPDGVPLTYSAVSNLFACCDGGPGGGDQGRKRPRL